MIGKSESEKHESIIISCLKEQGYQVEKLDMDSSGGKHPDCLVSNESRNIYFYVEIKSLNPQKEFDTKRELEDTIKREFRPKIGAKWDLTVEVPQMLTIDEEEIDRLSNEIVSESKIFQNNVELMNKSELPMEYQHKNRIYTLITKPYCQEYKNDVHISTYPLHIKNRERIRDRMKKSIAQLKAVEDNSRSKVLIIYNNDPFLECDDIEQAMFGDSTVKIPIHDIGSAELFHDGENAKIRPDKNTCLSAVCLFNEKPTPRFEVIHNTFADIKLPIEAFRWKGNRQGFFQADQVHWIQH